MQQRRYRVYNWNTQELTNDITGFECDLGEINGVFIDGDYYKPEEGSVELSQSTGLFDKRGVEIYEGDIVKGNYLKGIGIIQWNEQFCKFDISHRMNISPSDEFEVIGNIYENKELLND